MTNIACVICETEDRAAVLFRRGIFAKDGPAISFVNVICKNCGLVYRDPRPGQEELNQIYKKIYLEERHFLSDEAAAISFVNTVDHKNKGEQIAYFLKDFLSDKSRVLDIGSGLGLVSGFLRQKFGLEARGIEPSELSARVSEKVFGLKVWRENFDDFVQKNNDAQKFDCIILHHVFEHFGDPLKNLVEIKNLLAPAGIVYLEVPNILDFRKPITQFFDFLHLYNYTPATLERVLKDGGFKVIRRNNNKKYRIQILAVVNEHPAPAISLGAANPDLAREIIKYCRKKRLQEVVLNIFNRLRDK